MDKTQKKYYTLFFEQIAQSIILLFLAISFLYSTLSKKALQYVHIRHIGIIVFAAITFFIISFLQIYKLPVKNPINGTKKFPFYLVIFILPILFAIIIPHKPLTADSLAFNNDIFSVQQHTPQVPQKPVKPRLLELQGGYIVMDDDSFGRWLPELYLNLDSWLGKKIKIEGAVWKNLEILSGNEFALGRMMMVCCAADMQPVGLIASWENAEALSDDDWVRLTGTISKTEYEGNSEPLIIVDSAEKITRPQFEYVYPF